MNSISIAALIFFLAGFIQGMTGFGAGLVAMPLLLLFLEARVAVPLSMLNGLLITAFLSFQLRRHLEWQKILPLCLGCAPGIFLGAVWLRRADETMFRILLGLLLIAYGSYSILAHPRPRQLAGWWSYAAGFGSGAISAAFSTGGPPAVIFTTMTGWNKDVVKATLSGFFFITGTWAALAHAMAGLTTTTVFRYMGGSALAVLIGVWAGSAVYGRLTDRGYLRIVLFMLTGMGAVTIGTIFW